MVETDTERLRQSIAGSLYGLLVGDALGCPIEGWSPDSIAARYGRFTEMVERRSGWSPAQPLVEIEAGGERSGGNPGNDDGSTKEVSCR